MILLIFAACLMVSCAKEADNARVSQLKLGFKRDLFKNLKTYK